MFSTFVTRRIAQPVIRSVSLSVKGKVKEVKGLVRSLPGREELQSGTQKLFCDVSTESEGEGKGEGKG